MEKFNQFLRAMEIFKSYMDPEKDHPSLFHCEHDILHFFGVSPDQVSEEDLKELDDLGFLNGTENSEGFYSYRFGSC